MTDFYRKFEDKYRGSRTVILNRLQKYHSVLLNCLTQFANPIALDLGCGRGEWLEYLNGLGYQASGIDLDSEMLEACRERDLQVTCANLFEYLPQVPDKSVHLLSAFHLIEHITFSQLQTLMQEAKRILAPNGLLILETPNPENISVSCTSFYLDPTHEKPIPPLFMDFMAEYHGFVNAQIARLDNYKVIDDAQPTTLNDVLFYASPDYALIAQAPANPQWDWSTGILDNLNGHSLDDMTSQFDQQQASLIEQQTSLTEQQASLIEQQTSLTEQQTSLTEQVKHIHQELQTLRTFQLEVTNSYAWKLQAPLRWLQTNINKQRHQAQKRPPLNLRIRLFKSIKTLEVTVKVRIVRLLMTLQHSVQKHPKIQNSVIRVLAKFPRLSNRLRRLLHPIPSDNQMPQNTNLNQLCARGTIIFRQLEQSAKQSKQSK